MCFALGLQVMFKIEGNRQIALDNGNIRLSFIEYREQNGMPIFGLHGSQGSSLQLSLFDAAVEEVGVQLIALFTLTITLRPRKIFYASENTAFDKFDSVANRLLERRKHPCSTWGRVTRAATHRFENCF